MVGVGGSQQEVNVSLCNVPKSNGNTMCVNVCVSVRRDDCSGWMLAQHWKPQDGGDLMLGLHFSIFPRKRKKRHPIMFGLSFPVLSCYFFPPFISPFQLLTAAGKRVKKCKAVLDFSTKMDKELRSSHRVRVEDCERNDHLHHLY